jgi:type I restriction enzyme M protein
MLTDPKLRSQIDQLWDKLWTGGLSNPMDAIEQLSYLLFLKRLDDAENQAEKQAKVRGQLYLPRTPEEMRWRHWTNFEAKEALKHVRERDFYSTSWSGTPPPKSWSTTRRIPGHVAVES